MNKEELQNSKIDYAIFSAKSLASLIPGIGGIVSEIIGEIIPNQRIDRIVRFLEILDEKLKLFEHDILDLKMKLPEYVDLFEDCLIASTRALTDERKVHIANLFANGLKNEEAEIINYKKMLFILNQLDDIDLLLLRNFVAQFNKIKSDVNRYKDIIVKTLHLDSPEESENLYLRKKYLESIGLIHNVHNFDETIESKIIGIPRLFTIMLFKEIGEIE